jgi:subtilisin family serine protease/subtilisin-like proprotein convertase family protein
MSKRMDRRSASPMSFQSGATPSATVAMAGQASFGGPTSSDPLERPSSRLAKWLGGMLGTTSAMESLESRQMLSGDPIGPVLSNVPNGFEVVNWDGGQVVARTGSYLVEFDSYIGKAQAEALALQAAARLGVTAVSAQAYGLGRYAAITVQGNIDGAAAAALVGHMDHLVSIEPDRLAEVSRLPNDTRFSEQYALRNVGQVVPATNGFLGTLGADIHVENVWDISIGTRANIVAVIDTGVDLTHPDLAANIWTNPNEIAGNGIDDDGNGYVDDVHGFDFANQDSDPTDEPTGGHGTQVASCIGATGNNGTGVVGVNWNVSIMALKIADSSGRLSTNAIVAAHDYATYMLQHGTNIVASNNSYGAFLPAFYAENLAGYVQEKAAIQRFVDAGGTFVASAGNSANDNDLPTAANFPASYDIPQIISVAATDNNDALATFSSYGVQSVDVAAPGVDILMAQEGGLYGYNDGTSFSSPIVAGVVALLKSIKPNASAVEIKQALIDGSDPVAALQGKVRSGGRINVERSLKILQTSGPLVRSVNPGPVVGQISAATGQSLNQLSVLFTKDINGSLLTSSSVSLIGAGADGAFGTSDDVTVPVTSVAVSTTNPRQVNINLALGGFANGRLPVQQYRLTLRNATIKDASGNFLNGNNASGTDEIYNFRVVASTGDNESNDTLATATPIAFDASGQANLTGVSLGNGLAGNLDVDLYRIDIPRGGEITVEITAKRLRNPSSLDSYLRLFNARGEEIARNDNTNAQDSLIDFFVVTGGSYYIGVSGFGNAAYNPTIIASGTTQSLGVYDINMKVQLSSDDTLTFASTDPNLPRRIPVDPAETQGVSTSTISIADSRLILDVNVKLDIVHTFDGDLTISLLGPNNVEIKLVERRGGNGDNFSATVFDDEATLAIIAGAAPFNGAYRPEQSLGGFDGISASGLWTLKIVDGVSVNSGTLNSWSLQFTFQNDVFGSYESNDTLATAKDLPNINGTGTAEISAFIGDGGFGSLDRDIFRFRADSGASLTAIVNPTAAAGAAEGTLPTLNSSLRLFDESGVEIKLSNPSGSLISSVENYVFPNSGIFYLAVGESNNTTYNAKLINDGTGRVALTTGTYKLTVTLAAGVSDPVAALTGNQLDVTANSGGNFAGTDAAGNSGGLNFNGIEFIPTTGGIGQQVFNGFVAGGYNWSNSGAYANASTQLPFSLVNQSDAYNQRLVATGVYRGISIQRSVSYGVNDSFMAIDMTFTNTTQTLVPGLAWMEGFNPDPGIGLGENNRSTANDIDSTGHVASAKYVNNQYGQGLTVALVTPAAETRARLNFLTAQTTARDPNILATETINDPNGATSDSQIAVSYNLGDLGAGLRVTMRYFIMFGTSSTAVTNLITQLNNGTGTGHLTAVSSAPATEALSTGGAAVNVPTLPYRVYYPEGFFGNNIYTFLPISNPNAEATRVVVIARYEQGARDQLVGDLTLAANSRSGLTLVTPELFAAGTALAGRPNVNGVAQSYALEIRSERPVAATFSHYDLNQAGGARVAIGQSFTTRVDTQWSFGNVTKGGGNSDFLLFYNTTAASEKVTITFYPLNGGTVFTDTFVTRRANGTLADGLEGYRRGGISINDEGFLPDGQYGVTVTCNVPIVASLTHFDATNRSADGQIGAVGLGSRTAVTPEGQFSLNATSEALNVLNAGTTAAAVTFTFSFSNGSAYRTLVTVPARSAKQLNVQDLLNFPTGKPYSVSYDSDQPVTVSEFSPAFNDGVFGGFTDKAYSRWGFGEGFRPGDNDNAAGVTEYIRLYNPQVNDVTVEITISYDGLPGTETFRRTIPGRRMVELNMDQFITGDRRLRSSWYSTTVKAASPIVAYMAHFDRSFPGAFGTLGTPMGVSGTAS